MSGPYQAKGTTLGYGSGSPVTYTVVALVSSIDGPSLEVGTIETTVIASASKSYIPGLPDGGEISLTVQYDPTNSTHQEFTTLFTTPVITPWQLTFPSGSTWVFSGIVTGFAPGGMEPETLVTADVSIKLSGVPTFTP